MAEFSVKSAIASYLATDRKTWEHERIATVGASEIGQCARRNWFAKHGARQDGGEISKGAMERGNLIEEHLWVPAVKAAIEQTGGTLLYSGEQQRTFVDGYLSATPDGLAIDMPADALAHKGVEDCGGLFLTECKSIDPRVNLADAKSEHAAQVQVQLGLVRFATEYQPEYAILSYIDASFVDQVTEFIIKFDPAIYAAAKTRALKIMDSDDAIALRPEGKMAGGKECGYCPWASRCADITAMGVPRTAKEIGANAAAEIEALAIEAASHKQMAKTSTEQQRLLEEQIKEHLRDAHSRVAKTDRVSVTYSTVKGRNTTDLKAAEAAGIDLSPFIKTGQPSERLTVTIKEKEEEQVNG